MSLPVIAITVDSWVTRQGPAGARIRLKRRFKDVQSIAERACNLSLKLIGKQPQILRLTTPKLEDVWGPVRS